MGEDEMLARWKSHRDSLERQLEMMRSGKMKTLEGRADTTALSIKHAEATLASIERHIERETLRLANEKGAGREPPTPE